MNILHAQWKDFHLIGDGGIIPVRIKEDNSSGNNYSVKQISLLAQPIRSTTQIWVVTRDQYGISALVSQTSFGGETSGSVAKCRLFSQASETVVDSLWLSSSWWQIVYFTVKTLHFTTYWFYRTKDGFDLSYYIADKMWNKYHFCPPCLSYIRQVIYSYKNP